MPTRTRPPDLLAHPGQDIPPTASAPGAPGKPAGATEEPPWDGLRLVAVPAGWPPYDCEAHGAACPAAVPDPPANGQDAGGQDAGGQGAGGQGAGGQGADGWDGTAVAPAIVPVRVAAPGTGGTAMPDGEATSRGAAEPRLAAAWPGQFGQVLVEILAGSRPAKQLAPWTTERVRSQIDLLSCAVAAEQRPRIRRVMTSRPIADVVEMTMVVGFGPRSRALAIRFERIPARPAVPGRPARPARWLCTEIETS